MSDCTNLYRRMDYYTDRCTKSNFRYIADRCTKGDLNLWDSHWFYISHYEGNIFSHEFDVEPSLRREYLFSMDYLTYVLTEYKRSKKEVYKKTFDKIINQFHQYLETEGPFYSDLPIYAQTLLFIKALDILGDIPHQNDFLELLKKYAVWLMDDTHYEFDNNHGLFQDLALLHISVLFEREIQSKIWREHAIRRVTKLFEIAYYKDFTNNENSIIYFKYNNYLYGQIIKFCNYYQISGIKKIESALEKSKEALIVFAHKDTSFPLIGDGSAASRSTESNDRSCLFPDLGVAILKIEEVYMSFKCKTVFQSHAHTDLSSITARYKNIDFLIDPGQYNYDRYSPVNRFLRSSAGHSGIFPIFADCMFQKKFCEAIKRSEITVYEYYGGNARVKGEYQLNDVSVCREIFVLPNEITVKDSWSGEKPTVMRQRFIIPKQLIERSKFTVSQRTLESGIGNIKFKYEIIFNPTNALTVVHFGVAAPQYNDYETTMLLDTIAENTLSGQITAKISFWEEP